MCKLWIKLNEYGNFHPHTPNPTYLCGMSHLSDIGSKPIDTVSVKMSHQHKTT